MEMNRDSHQIVFSTDEIIVRAFAQGDEDEVVGLWGKVAESERDIGTLTLDDFWNRVMSNPNFDSKGAFLAYSGETLVGFCLVTVRKEPFRVRSLKEFPAFISAIMVHPSYRRRGIGSRLISKAVGYAESQGKREIRTGFDNPIPLFIGVDVSKKGVQGFFSKHGFEEEIELVMRLSLLEFEKQKEIKQLQERVARVGVSVSPLERQDAQGMLELLKQNAVWWYEPMVKDVETGELDMANMFVAREGEAIAGFVRVDEIGERGDVWGILVHPEKQCKGIGTLLLFSALSKLKKDGVRTVNLTTGSSNFSAQRIYGKAGFRKIGAFAMFRKAI